MIKRPRGTSHINNRPGTPPARGRSRITVSPEVIDQETLRDIVMIANEVWPSVRPFLTHRPPPVQAAILAQLTSLWLTAYAQQGEPPEELLRVFVSLVRTMTRMQGSMLDKAIGKN
jgi:hypothetical protein